MFYKKNQIAPINSKFASTWDEAGYLWSDAAHELEHLAVVHTVQLHFLLDTVAELRVSNSQPVIEEGNEDS